MASLVITIVTYALFKVLRGEKSGKILLNLCVALLLLNTIFLVGTVDVSDFSNTTCVAVALMMHLLVLAALMWMLVEAIEMYQALVTVFTSYERLYLLKRCIIGWGIPVLIVAITAAVDISSYENKKENRDVCYLTSDNKATYYASLVAPACLIIIINTIIFIMVARVILKPRFQQQPASTGSVSVTPAQVRGAFAVMFLMGIPWIFGPLALREARVVFAYLFTICNSLQGFLIFVFRCLFNPEAKLAWIQLFTTGTLKRRRGPIKSMYTDTSSKGADSQGRRLSNSNSGTGYHASGTTRTTISKNGTGSHPHPHQLHTTNGWHPSLNGMRRESDYKDGPPGYSTNDSRSSSRSLSPLDRRSSEDLTTVVKRGSPPDEYGRPYPDEMTHF
ncbi:adhesion G-protein coupled receptor G2 [Aplysia californica]|uniref:Adhesion G-protein coupled receptor G2 n=1 Tax=Aplysia californica TaxID=6500 RepID=A0ABM0ZZE8_APLCA|nr:adhesion G-protein coupled receptor G2 [Aplysia californica]